MGRTEIVVLSLAIGMVVMMGRRIMLMVVVMAMLMTVTKQPGTERPTP
ncbi:MAG: hypothetical protein KKF33_07555 [Alphaproteobacteria bacterium]|nr:hypothetical protein [Alphaproteobacteria bacterium]